MAGGEEWRRRGGGVLGGALALPQCKTSPTRMSGAPSERGAPRGGLPRDYIGKSVPASVLKRLPPSPRSAGLVDVKRGAGGDLWSSPLSE